MLDDLKMVQDDLQEVTQDLPTGFLSKFPGIGTILGGRILHFPRFWVSYRCHDPKTRENLPSSQGSRRLRLRLAPRRFDRLTASLRSGTGRENDEKYKMPYVTTWERRAKEEGIALGMEKGARNRNIEIAREMIVEGISLDIICKTTGLSRSEVESLQAEEPVH